ncbi:Broad-Complex, Tramtrack and Bric a brac [Halocaridina rubra]|uniref:Broad-Complex, Tramtrack and Bric a brac n=1 Tax=Halocaridina rubra TaxID=373956 RepID=A0AAN8XBB5_HALRR
MAEGTTRMAEGMLSLSWNNHGAAFSQMLSTLRTKEIYTDVTLACGGKFYPVHKFVLSTCSDYFLEMFEKTTCKHPIVILKDVQCREMEALLSYMYAGIVCVPQSDLAQLIIVAEALQIKGLAVPDETMCANKRMSYTWNPANDSISPHAKRLRPDEGNPGVQYQRFQDGHTVIKPQTLTGIPSFAAGMPTRGYSPTTASPGIRHVQSTVRPTHTATLHSQRYSPYTKETECRQSSSPNSTNKIVIKYTQGKSKADQNQNVESSSNGKQMDTKYATSSTPTFQNNDPEASTSTASQTYSPEMEILPETAVKVELEEGSEPINVDSSGMILFPSSPSDPDSSRRKSISKSHGRASHEKYVYAVKRSY